MMAPDPGSRPRHGHDPADRLTSEACLDTADYYRRLVVDDVLELVEAAE